MWNGFVIVKKKVTQIIYCITEYKYNEKVVWNKPFKNHKAKSKTAKVKLETQITWIRLGNIGNNGGLNTVMTIMDNPILNIVSFEVILW